MTSAPDQQVTGTAAQKAAASAMIAAHNLGLFTLIQPYDLRRAEELAALIAVYRSEPFSRACPVDGPGDAPVRYLFVVGGEPVLMREAGVPDFVFGAALVARGWEAALQVLHQPDILS